MDLNLRKIASTALVVIAVELAVAALYFRLAGASAVNTFIVAVVLAVAAFVGRAGVGPRSSFAFATAIVASVWLFVSTWTLARTPTGLLANDLVFAVLAFGFACAPFEDRPRTVDVG